MSRKFFPLLLVALIAWAVSPAQAQKKIKEGSITLTIEKGENDSPEMAMLEGSKFTFTFANNKQKVDIDMMGGMMHMVTVADLTDLSKAFMLMDMLGMRYHITDLDADELASSNSFANFDNLTEIKEDKDDRLEILGYDCYRVEATSTEGNKLVYYVSDKIQPPSPVKKTGKTLQGFPLKMIIDMGMGEGSVLTFTATEINPKVDAKAFDPPAESEGYQKITMEQFMKEMNSMGN